MNWFDANVIHDIEVIPPHASGSVPASTVVMPQKVHMVGRRGLVRHGGFAIVNATNIR